jgi:aminoglycoside phosphotransferase (APT) family kinase protein
MTTTETGIVLRAGGRPTSRDLQSSLMGNADLDRWLQANCFPEMVRAEVTAAARVAGGNSYETWFLTVTDSADDAAAAADVVMRREPIAGPLEPYDILREAQILKGLESTDVPAPRVLGACADRGIADRPFEIIERLSGDVPDYRNVTSHDDWRRPGGRQHMTREFMRGLASIQSVEWRAPGFGNAFGLDGSETLRPLVHRMIDARVSTVDRHLDDGWPPVPSFYDAAAWLKRHAPDAPADELVLVHGDYRVGNFMWSDHTLTSILDWEGADVGDPLQDLGYACHNVMRQKRPDLMAMLAPFEEFVTAYEQATGRTVDVQRLHYWVVYGLFYHLWTILMALPAVAHRAAKPRVALTYFKVSQCSVFLAQQIEAFEAGHDVV